MKIDKTIPTLIAFECEGDKTHLYAWCPYCVMWHLHGRSAGHRVAHCGDTPFSQRGYYLAYGGKLPRSVFSRKPKRNWEPI